MSGAPELIGDRAHWWHRVRTVAPAAPSWFSTALTRVLIAPDLNADALLILADALEEAGSIANTIGETALAAQLRALAELPRELAPSRADLEGER